jgi:hypothetical protein
MRIRTILSAILCSAVLGSALGCSDQPTAPSNLASPSTVGITVRRRARRNRRRYRLTIRRSHTRLGLCDEPGLYYDTFVVKDPLPMNGPFQLLADGQTEFGPGQPGYLGGRWWEDSNENGMQDPEDHFFLCPLLPPGRPTP